MKDLKTTALSLLFALFFPFLFSAQPTAFQWKQVAPGVWKATVGKPEKLTPLGVAEIEPRVDALQKLGTPAFPETLQESKNELADDKVYLHFPL